MTPSPRSQEAALRAGWHLAVRVALVSSVLMVALVYGLRRFVGIDSRYLVGLALSVGLYLGQRLPAARPARPSWAPVPSHH